MTRWLPIRFIVLVLLGVLSFIVLKNTIFAPSDTGLSCPPLPWISKALTNQRRVLVTGAAGFIGYHSSLRLRKAWEAHVVGLDNFNDYYSVQLKLNRAALLSREGVKVYRGDLCDGTLLRSLFDKYDFTHVLHLAGRTGVRASLKDPAAYAATNIGCFLSLLDVIKDRKNTSLVFASSSSVYGEGAQVPFSTHSPPHTPGNMYAATKLLAERFAETYCALYGVPVIGLRLFTVYGPWGRPDMAVYDFTDRIVRGLPLHLYSASQSVHRDFTYIDDVVDGIMLALDHLPLRCGEVFNIGHATPHSLETLVGHLEEELGRRANKVYLPLSSYELQTTWADISLSRSVLSYCPKVSLKEGLHRFVQWYLWYGEKGKHSVVMAADILGTPDNMCALWAEEENARSRERADLLRGQYLQYAHVNNVTLPEIKKNRFLYYAGVDSPGGTIITAQDRSVKYLMEWCLQTEQCVAFNSGGELKSSLVPQHQWTTRGTGGLYVADIDVCAADLHSCGRHSTCQSTGPSTFSCTCGEGYEMLPSGCVRRYEAGPTPAHEEERWRMVDTMNGLDWEELAGGRSFVFFPGLDSPGGDYLFVRGDVTEVMETCRHTYRCVAFNTNGILKSFLFPPLSWKRWTTQPQHGLYVLDLPYCHLGSDLCPEGSCIRHGPGNYSCILETHSTGSVSGDGNGMKGAPSDGDGVRGAPSDGDDVRGAPSDDDGVRGAPSDGDGVRGAPSDGDGMRGAPSDGDGVRGAPSDGNGVRGAPSDGDGVRGAPRPQIIMSVDSEHLPGLVVAMTSILKHSPNPNLIKFHLVVAGLGKRAVQDFLSCYNLFLNDQLHVVEFNTSWLQGLVHVQLPIEAVGNLASEANFARFWFAGLFPGLKRALYLDADVVVQSDISLLWGGVASSQQLLAVVERGSPTYGDVFGDKVMAMFRERYKRSFKNDHPTFNAGVYGVNLDLWRQKMIHKEVLYWMKEHAREPLWMLGTQPIMLLIGYNQWDRLDPRWNVNGLGWNQHLSEDILKDAFLLHWTGKRKPWHKDGLYKSLWQPYLPAPCSGHGVCVRHLDSYSCDCSQEYSGAVCQNKS